MSADGSSQSGSRGCRRRRRSLLVARRTQDRVRRFPSTPRWAFFVMNADGRGVKKVNWALPGEAMRGRAVLGPRRRVAAAARRAGRAGQGRRPQLPSEPVGKPVTLALERRRASPPVCGRRARLSGGTIVSTSATAGAQSTTSGLSSRSTGKRPRRRRCPRLGQAWRHELPGARRPVRGRQPRARGGCSRDRRGPGARRGRPLGLVGLALCRGRCAGRSGSRDLSRPGRLRGHDVRPPVRPRRTVDHRGAGGQGRGLRAGSRARRRELDLAAIAARLRPAGEGDHHERRALGAAADDRRQPRRVRAADSFAAGDPAPRGPRSRRPEAARLEKEQKEALASSATAAPTALDRSGSDVAALHRASSPCTRARARSADEAMLAEIRNSGLRIATRGRAAPLYRPAAPAVLEGHGAPSPDAMLAQGASQAEAATYGAGHTRAEGRPLDVPRRPRDRHGQVHRRGRRPAAHDAHLHRQSVLAGATTEYGWSVYRDTLSLARASNVRFWPSLLADPATRVG